MKKTVEILVCDICGGPAVTQRTVDVCEDHRPGKGIRPTQVKEPCPICSRLITVGTAMASHLRYHENRGEGQAILQASRGGKSE